MTIRLINPVLAGTQSRVVIDSDALAYIAAIESADAQSLENGVKDAIINLIVGLKSDGVWTSILSSCILAGARTRIGALTPLAGTAPTSVNFVDGDYDRKLGLIGNGSTKYINTNRNNNADPQDDNHNLVWVTSAQTSGVGNYIGAGGGTDAGTNNIVSNVTGSELGFRSRNSAAATIGGQHLATGLIGHSRASSASYTYELNGSQSTFSQSSQTPYNGNLFVFARNISGTANALSDARIRFYSAGTSVNTSLIRARLTTFFAAIGAAIP